MSKYKSILLLSAAFCLLMLSPAASRAEKDLEREMGNVLMAKKNKMEYLVRAQKIKSISQAFYDYNEKLKAFDPNPSKRLTLFDPDGNKTEEQRISYDPQTKTDVVTDIYNYTYNEIKNMTEERHRRLTAEANYELVSKSVHKYNDKNKLVETLRYNNKEEFAGSVERSYDKDWNEIKKDELDKDRKVFKRTVFKYGESGIKTESEEYAVTDGNSSLKTNIKYDELGNETTVTSYEGGKIYTVTEFKYDIAGNMTEAVKTEAGGTVIEKKTFEYDDVKNLTGETHYGADNQTCYKANYKYNEKNKLTEEQCYRLKADPKTGKSSLALTDKYSHSYNEQDNPSVSTRFDEKDAPVTKATAAYDFYVK